MLPTKEAIDIDSTITQINGSVLVDIQQHLEAKSLDLPYIFIGQDNQKVALSLV